MRILLTGATGFVGRHVLDALVRRDHEVLAVSRYADGHATQPPSSKVRYQACDLHGPHAAEVFDPVPDVVIHLAWPGLPNYQQTFHFEQNFIADWRFLHLAVGLGVKHLLVAGTGAEYGMLSGELDEEGPTAPVNAYGIAKDALRRCLFHLQRERDFVLQWVRLFHLHGTGQNDNSLLARLAKAIKRGDKEFPMSGGEQLRDYLPVEEAARRIALLAERSDIHGAINCGSGRPVSVRNLAEAFVARQNAELLLRFGALPYPDYEPMAYWGRIGKLTPLLAASES